MKRLIIILSLVLITVSCKTTKCPVAYYNCGCCSGYGRIHMTIDTIDDENIYIPIPSGGMSDTLRNNIIILGEIKE